MVLEIFMLLQKLKSYRFTKKLRTATLCVFLCAILSLQKIVTVTASKAKTHSHLNLVIAFNKTQNNSKHFSDICDMILCIASNIILLRNIFLFFVEECLYIKISETCG